MRVIPRLKKFFEEARQEFRHVNWPTRNEAVKLTALVIGISLGIAAFLGSFDYLFSFLLRLLVLR
ncbi:MAG: preprotein translocase subunit SecE [Candidatus Liptonbacteria bacterium]|nr:preprotein translocase subunit SecE [Candidatus Liptonbacteria bacterium]